MRQKNEMRLYVWPNSYIGYRRAMMNNEWRTEWSVFVTTLDDWAHGAAQKEFAQKYGQFALESVHMLTAVMTETCGMGRIEGVGWVHCNFPASNAYALFHVFSEKADDDKDKGTGKNKIP